MNTKKLLIITAVIANIFFRCQNPSTANSVEFRNPDHVFRTPSVLISPTGFSVNEGGLPVSISVSLGARPTGSVLLDISSAFPAEFTVSPLSLTFTSENYDVAQTISVTFPENNLVDGFLYYDITLPALLSADEGYSNLSVPALEIYVNDNDTSPMAYPVNPVFNQINVSRARQISAVFDKDIDLSTINPATFLLSDLSGQPISGNFIYSSGDNRKFSFSPLSFLNWGEKYTATLTTGITDTFGNPLQKEISWSFQIESGYTPELQDTASVFAYDVFISGNYAYVAAHSSGLQIYNVTNPAAITGPVTLPLAGSSIGVYITGNYAYVAAGLNGIHVVDITNPASPVLKATYDTPGSAREIFVEGNTAFVADGLAVEIIDVSNQTCGTPLCTLSSINSFTVGGASIKDITVSGGLAYVLDHDTGLHIVDVTSLSTPIVKGNYDYDTSGYSNKFHVIENYAYIADETMGLFIVDVSDSSNPTLSGSYNTTGYAKNVFVSGDMAFVADSIKGLKTIGVKNKNQPFLAGSNSTLSNVQNLFISGDYAYVLEHTSGSTGNLRVFNIKETPKPEALPVFSTNTVKGVFVSEGYAFLAQGTSGFEIIDISDTDSYTLTAAHGSGASYNNVFVEGSRAYFAVESPGKVEVYDVSNKKDPVLLGEVGGLSQAFDIAVSGNYAYVADMAGGLRIIDVAGMSVVKTIATGDATRGVFVSGNYAYAADIINGLIVIDISDPLNAVPTGSIACIAGDVYISDDYAYVSDFINGFRLINVSNKSAPVIEKTISSTAFGVYGSGNFAFVAANNGGIDVIDLTDLAAPVLTANIPFAGTTNISISNGYAYAAGTAGLLPVFLGSFQ